MAKPTGFLEFERIDFKKRNPDERLKDYNEIIKKLDETTLKNQAARCMDCGIPFCHSGITVNNMTSGCPLHNLIPEWNELVYLGKWKEAYHRLAKTNPFPEFTGRVCPAPCEGSCTNGLNNDSVTIKSIEYHIIENAFKSGYVKPYTGPKTTHQVCIVGAGPAGLSAAHYLINVGHNVTVYDKYDKAGGLLYLGIPEMKLEKSIIERRINILKASGVEFVFNTMIGKDISAQTLEEEYDVVLLATGAEVARDLDLPGRDLKGVHLAMEYLSNVTKNIHNKEKLQIDAKNKNVVIIGGGDTATDCVATALRQKCKSVMQLEIMTQKPLLRDKNNPWPEYPNIKKTDYGQIESLIKFNKDPRFYSKTVKRFLGKKKLESLEIVDVSFDKGKLSFIENTVSVIPADLVFIAIGFIGPVENLLEAFDVTRNKAEHHSKNFNFNTEKDNVYIAGDMRRGQSLVVSALEEGKQVAKTIDEYLMGSSSIV